MAAALSVDDLRSGYGETEILHGVSFRVEEGEMYALVGKNGAGKTTLLKTVLKLLSPRRGRIALFGEDIAKLDAHEIAGRSVGYAPQENAFFPDLSVQENLRLAALGLRRGDFQERRQRMGELFPFLEHRMRQRAGTLSGGEQKMLNVARALLPRPRMVLLDEVSEGLQPSVLERIKGALGEENRESGLTIVVVEQNIKFVLASARSYALIERGFIGGQGSIGDANAVSEIEKHLAI